MNKFTKISAAALFALFLTACDKPAETKAVASEAQQAPAQVAENTQAQQTVATTEAVNVSGQAAQDYKKIVDWNAEQEKVMASAQTELQEKLASGDKAKIEEGFKAFTVKVDEVLKSLDALEIKDEAILAFKAKMKSYLTLSNGLIGETVTLMTNPTEQAQKAIQEKTQVLMNEGMELQKLQAELQQKFAQ